MKILYHHRTRAEDAQGIHIREIVKAFIELGHEVKVFALSDKNKSKAKKKISNKWMNLSRNFPSWLYEMMSVGYNFYGYKQIADIIISWKPDLIYERYSLNTYCGVYASRRFGIPILLEVNAPLYIEQKKLKRLAFRSFAAFSERWACSNSFKTIVVSNVLKKIMVKQGVPSEKLEVIPNAINPEIFNTQVDGSRTRRIYGLEGKVVVGFVGWLRKWHGLDLLLKAYVEQEMESKNIHLLLVGDGPEYTNLFDFCKSRGLIERSVTFTGAVDQRKVPEYIAAFDLAIQPDATDYSSPIKIFEYMAIGKGVIAPRKQNILEILGEEYDAFFEPENWNEMARLIMFYGSSRSRARELGGKAIDRLLKMKYLWSENAKRALSLILEK